jgi:hypothetical protein
MLAVEASVATPESGACRALSEEFGETLHQPVT